jgi:hypothetical protein
MFLFYVLAALPVLVGIYVWFHNAEVTWLEWLGSSALSFILAGIIHYCAIRSMVADTQTLNGLVNTAVHIPSWTDLHPETRTRKVGKVTTTYTVWVTAHHPDRYWVDTDIGQFSVDGGKYFQLLNLMGGKESSSVGSRPYMVSGDRLDYSTINSTKWEEPVNDYVYFENRIKACPSVFSYAAVEKDVPVFEYPTNNHLFQSERLLGQANAISLGAFDKMNGRLGPWKKVNVIMCGFQGGSASLGISQECKWIGGKKNDIVICYGVDESRKVTWSYVFGWTEKDIVKRNLETIMLQNPVNTAILPLIEKEIIDNYEIKDWHKFDYLTIPIPGRFYVYFLIFMVITQVGYYYWAFSNDIGKNPREKDDFGHFIKKKVNSFKGKRGSGHLTIDI